MQTITLFGTIVPYEDGFETWYINVDEEGFFIQHLTSNDDKRSVYRLNYAKHHRDAVVALKELLRIRGVKDDTLNNKIDSEALRMDIAFGNITGELLN